MFIAWYMGYLNYPLIVGGKPYFSPIFPFPVAYELTILLAAFFVAQGIVKIMAALRQRPASGWGWLMFSGILGIIVGVIIWAALPEAAIWVLGLLVGIELIFSGWAMVMIAMAGKKEPDAAS